MFAFNPESFAARCQDVCLRGLTDDPFGQCSGRVDHVLTIIEHKKYFLVANKGGETAQRILGLHHKPERRCDRCRYELGIGQRGQIDEENRPVETIRQRVGNGDGDSGLSDAARADDADEPRHHQLCRYGANDGIAADHAESRS